MIVRVKIADDPFARVRKAVLSDKRISWKAKGILAYLLGKPADWEVRTEDIIAKGPDGRDAVRAAFKEMKEFGYASLVPARADSGHLAGNHWLITDATDDHRETGFPALGRETGFPADGKSPPTKNEKSTKKDGVKKKARLESSPEAEEIYAAYPKKVGQPAALKSIAKAIKLVGAPTLLEKTKAFAAARGSNLEFVPHPATWFNQHRFNDDPETWKPNDTNKKPTARGSGRNDGTANAGKHTQYGGRILRSVRLPEGPGANGDEKGSDAVPRGHAGE